MMLCFETLDWMLLFHFGVGDNGRTLAFDVSFGINAEITCDKLYIWSRTDTVFIVSALTSCTKKQIFINTNYKKQTKENKETNYIICFSRCLPV